MFQLDGKVCVGPGVEEAAVCDAVGVAAAVVPVGVGVGVTGGVAGCVHPAARASTAQSTSADVITSVLFIPDNYMGGYLMVVSLGAGSVSLYLEGKDTIFVLICFTLTTIMI